MSEDGMNRDLYVEHLELVWCWIVINAAVKEPNEIRVESLSDAQLDRVKW